jgi:hypothetical protein
MKDERKVDIAALHARMELMEHPLLTRLGTLYIVINVMLLAALHYWPPG